MTKLKSTANLTNPKQGARSVKCMLSSPSLQHVAISVLGSARWQEWLLEGGTRVAEGEEELEIEGVCLGGSAELVWTVAC